MPYWQLPSFPWVAVPKGWLNWTEGRLQLSDLERQRPHHGIFDSKDAIQQHLGKYAP
jgi:hypothetical protein